MCQIQFSDSSKFHWHYISTCIWQDIFWNNWKKIIISPWWRVSLASCSTKRPLYGWKWSWVQVLFSSLSYTGKIFQKWLDKQENNLVNAVYSCNYQHLLTSCYVSTHITKQEAYLSFIALTSWYYLKIVCTIGPWTW